MFYINGNTFSQMFIAFSIHMSNAEQLLCHIFGLERVTFMATKVYNRKFIFAFSLQYFDSCRYVSIIKKMCFILNFYPPITRTILKFQ